MGRMENILRRSTIFMDTEKTTGVLYLCGTPIGNLEDMTFRAVRILKEVSLIACEDTRNSIKLLNHFEIKTPMTSYHEFNKIEKAKALVDKLKEGNDIALITDAGMPAISDPGQELVKMCHDECIDVRVVPGPSAVTSAVALSGMVSGRFCFEAFLPRENKERHKIFESLRNETRPIVIYEAPHHLKKTLSELMENLGDRNISIVKEITKKYEQTKLTTVSGALAYYEQNEPRGEYVLIISGKPFSQIEGENAEKWNRIPLDEHMQIYINDGLSKKEAMKKVAKDRGVTKREIYRELI